MGTNPMSHVARAIERGETAGFMKVIVDAASDKILGARSWALKAAKWCSYLER